MVAKSTIAAGLLALTAVVVMLLAGASSATVALDRLKAGRFASENAAFIGYPNDRGAERGIAETRKRREMLQLKLILGRWCDDTGQRWIFSRNIVIHDKHIHRARYERQGVSIVVVVDGYPDRFSKFTPDGLHMTLLSSALDRFLKMRRFTLCPALFSENIQPRSARAPSMPMTRPDRRLQ